MPEHFNNSLLLLARQYRERSQSEVTRAAGLNQGHYSRIENGLLPEGPSKESVNRIADALSFPPSFFYQSEDVVGLPLSVHPMHRKKESVGEKTLRRVHSELNLRLMHLRKLLSAVETHAVLPLPWIDIDDAGGPRQLARTMRTAWMIPPGPIVNLTDTAEKAGVLVIWCDFGAAIDGVTMRVPDLPPCVFLNRTVPADRMRFSLAHEICHVIAHRVPTDTMEDEANTFAAELLVPEKELQRDLIGGRITLERLARLKARWRVSMQFLLFQAKELDLLSSHQSQYLWKQISMKGWRTREPAETDFAHEVPTLFPRVLNLHLHDLKYGVPEFSELFHLQPNDLRYLYGIQETQGAVQQKGTLHILR
jgi:Zn-dependent peptidase ImmA (M78 family)/transcriptional regulator with XRE-family HTH domain